MYAVGCKSQWKHYMEQAFSSIPYTNGSWRCSLEKRFPKDTIGVSRWFFDDFSMIFRWFPRFCLIFSFEAKPAKIIEKSSKNYHFFYHCFFHSVQKLWFFYRCFYHSVCPLRTPASIPRNFFVSKSSWQTCWRWLSQGLNSARLQCTWTLGTPAANR